MGLKSKELITDLKSSEDISSSNDVNFRFSGEEKFDTIRTGSYIMSDDYSVSEDKFEKNITHVNHKNYRKEQSDGEGVSESTQSLKKDKYVSSDITKNDVIGRKKGTESLYTNRDSLKPKKRRKINSRLSTGEIKASQVFSNSNFNAVSSGFFKASEYYNRFRSKKSNDEKDDDKELIGGMTVTSGRTARRVIKNRKAIVKASERVVNEGKKLAMVVAKGVETIGAVILSAPEIVVAAFAIALIGGSLFLIIMLFAQIDEEENCTNANQITLCDTDTSSTYYWENDYNAINWGMKQARIANGSLYGTVFNDDSKGGWNYVYAGRYDDNGILIDYYDNTKYYLVALPSYYVNDGHVVNDDIGTKYHMVSENGDYYAVFADEHADQHTVQGNNSSSQNCIGEGGGMIGVWSSEPHSNVDYKSYVGGDLKSVTKLSEDTGEMVCSAGAGVDSNWRPDFSLSDVWRTDHGYAYGQCTWYAFGFLGQVYGDEMMDVASGLGNGNEWVSNLWRNHSEYWTFSTTPVAGCVFSATSINHVGIVLDYDSERELITIFEGNFDGNTNTWEYATADGPGPSPWRDDSLGKDWDVITLSRSSFESAYGWNNFAVPTQKTLALKR